MRDTFDQKVVIVTGAGSGIGACLANELAKYGAIVRVADVNEKAAQQVAAQICTLGGNSSASKVDVTQPRDVQNLVDEVVKEYGRLDYIFNNAGTTLVGEMRDLTLEQWHQIININLWGVVYGSHFAYRQMLTQGFGHIVNVASGFGITPGPTLIPYTASKHAVVGLSESLRIEAADLGIKISTACPGYVNTPLLNGNNAVRADNHDILEQIPFPLLEPQACSKRILAGVRRNQAVIVFPFYLRILTFIYRVVPQLSSRLTIQMVRNFRKIRREDVIPAANGVDANETCPSRPET